MTHTPGPWIRNDEHRPIVETYEIIGTDPDGSKTIIARDVPARQSQLIVNAPIMKDALEEIEKISRSYESGDDWYTLQGHIEDIKAQAMKALKFLKS